MNIKLLASGYYRIIIFNLIYLNNIYEYIVFNVSKNGLKFLKEHEMKLRLI